MKTGQLHWNRRREARHHCDFKTITWFRNGTHRTRRGWLNDQSWSGLSFIVPAQARPSVGDEIELAAQTRGDRTACRVVRITPAEDHRTIVGCEKDIPGQILLERKPKRRVVQNVRTPKFRTEKQAFATA